MDSSIATDPRFRLVAMRLKRDRKEIVGACYLVWLACYERRSKRLRVDEADASAELEGFSEAMVDAGLASLENNSRFVVFHGVASRISFLLTQAERGKRGGRASGKARRSAKLNGEANASADAKQTLQENEANASSCAQAYSPSPAPAPAPALKDPEGERAAPLALPPSPFHGQQSTGVEVVAPSKRRAKRQTGSPEERAIAAQAITELASVSGIAYEPGAEGNVAPVVKLIGEGRSLDDFIAVVGDRAKEWRGDEKMHRFLRPETVFGPKFGTYLAQAKARGGASSQAERELEDARRRRDEALEANPWAGQSR